MSARFAGVILAAGRSSRMGAPKALIPIEGRAIVDRLVEVYTAAGLTPVVVVASGAVQTHLARAGDGSALGVRSTVVIVEGDPSAPMIGSLARGITALTGVDGAIVQPVDAPFTTVEMISALTAGPSGRSRVLTSNGAPGHPVLVARALFDVIATEPDGGLRRLLEREPAEVVPFEDPRILADLDRPEDVHRWLGG
ncbi:NTP transferase domain-containing protein [Myxococcota bacterium]|nr:NTP transferase domain-containing protein [Myxococcota bacterium]